MRRPLDPTRDVVFVLMLTRGPNAEEALVGLLASILLPPVPIASVRVLDPQIAPIGLDAKSIMLDLLVTFDDGTLCVIEMQTTRQGAFLARLLFCWARAFVEQLPAGGSYERPRPTACIGLLADDDPRYPRGHARLGLRRDGREVRQTGLLAVHVVNLPRLLAEEARGRLAAEERQVLRRARFLLAASPGQATAIAAGDPAMENVSATLPNLFDDDEARTLARSREIGLRMYRHELAVSRDEGREAGREEGRDVGREDTARRLVERLLAKRGLPLDEGQRARLAEGHDEATLERWVEQVLDAATAEDALR